MNDLAQATAWAEALSAAGVAAYTDPRSATPPCVVISPPGQRYPTDCEALSAWRIYAIAPGGPNLDAWATLAEMQPAIVDILPVQERLWVAAVLSPDSGPMPAFCYLFERSVDP